MILLHTKMEMVVVCILVCTFETSGWSLADLSAVVVTEGGGMVALSVGVVSPPPGWGCLGFCLFCP